MPTGRALHALERRQTVVELSRPLECWQRTIHEPARQTDRHQEQNADGLASDERGWMRPQVSTQAQRGRRTHRNGSSR